jgi:YD repeat-containing protein
LHSSSLHDDNLAGQQALPALRSRAVSTNRLSLHEIPDANEEKSMLRRSPALSVLLTLIVVAASLAAQGSTIRYIYDELGRLVGVIDANGDAAAYHYDAVGNLLSITRSTATTVAIIEVTPDGGPVGQTVTIYGTGFSATANQNTVSFNGTSGSITAASTTTLTVTVPVGATTGTISVTSPNGSANSGSSFVVGMTGGPPSITSFSPTIGPAGTAVTITGTNFDSLVPQNRLTFNGRPAGLTSATTTSIGATIPAVTSSGRFSVTTGSGTAASTDDFFIPPSPYTASDVVTTARLAFSTLTNVSVATASKVALVLFDGTLNQRISLKIVPGPISNLTLYRPNVATLATHSTGIGTTLMEPPLLPAAGTYQFLLDPVGAGTGTLALTLYSVPADFSDTITVTSAGSSSTIATTIPGQNGRVTFAGTSGDRVSVAVGTGPLGTASLRKPDDSSLASAAIGVATSFIDTTVLPSSGTYSLFADFSGANTGSVTLTAYAVPADVSNTITSINLGGSAVGVPITTPGQNGVLTFSGTSGHRYSVSVSAGPSGSVALKRPDGTTQASVNSGALAAFIEPQTLSTTDAYSLRWTH